MFVNRLSSKVKLFLILLQMICIIFIVIKSIVYIQDSNSIFIQSIFRKNIIAQPGIYIYPEKLLSFLTITPYYKKNILVTEPILSTPQKISIQLEHKAKFLKDNFIDIDLLTSIKYKIKRSYQVFLLNKSLNYSISKIKKDINLHIKNIVKNYIEMYIVDNLNQHIMKHEQINLQNIIKNTKISFDIKMKDNFKINIMNLDILISKVYNLNIYNNSIKYIKDNIDTKINNIINNHRYENLERKNISRLEKYGKLLKKYPELIDFIYIENNIKKLKPLKKNDNKRNKINTNRY